MKKLIMLGLCGLLICGCSNDKTNNPNDGKDDNAVNPPVVEDNIDIIDTNSKTRPYAVMINCHNDALPQAGLNDAYIVYELTVEYGITRMMALYKDAETAKIGSVRSARSQYIDYVLENDAIYVHAGGSAEAKAELSNKKISHIDVDGVYGFRDRNLNRDWEHTLFTSTDLLATATNKTSLKTTTDNGTLLKYSAEELDLSKYEFAVKADDVSIKYSSYRTSSYKYDEENKTYLRYMNNNKNSDLVTKEQYTAKNIIAYAVKHTTYSHSGYYGYQRLDNIGNGEGYYISNGYAVPITWEKASEASKTIYKIKETGEELVVNDGNTYIQIYPTTGNMTIK